MTPFTYRSARSVDESIAALEAPGGTRTVCLAGGTDLLPLIKAGIVSPHTLVDIKRAADLSADIEIGPEATRLGALCTLGDIAHHDGLRSRHAALVQAARSAASPQLRNMATLGGTLLQRPRCWYFRNATFPCWLKGGTECHARHGLNSAHAIFDTGICRAAHPSDVACALFALDATIELRGRNGLRTVPVADFIQAPTSERRTETLLGPDELVSAVTLPFDPTAPLGRSLFLKAMDRASWAFATASVVAKVRMQEDRFGEIEVVLGAVAAIPWRVTPHLQSLVGCRVDEATVAAALRQALEEAASLSLNGYKVPLALGLARRAVMTLARPS